MKKAITHAFFTIMLAAALAMFPSVTKSSATFSRLHEDAEGTMKRYEDCWDATDIEVVAAGPAEYAEGQETGRITIPRMGIYEMPVYYGANEINNNWQITTPGYLGNWGMVGDSTPACVGAHNYQLFKELPALSIGDKIIFENDVDVYVYEVTGMSVYKQSLVDWRTATVEAAKEYSVILTTCYPLDATDTQDRYIVYTELKSGTIFE